MVERDQPMDRRAGRDHSGAGAGSCTEPQPALMDQPPDHRAGDRLGHRPARRRPVGRAERAVALGQHAVGRGDQHAVGARRTGEERIQRRGQRRRGEAGGVHRIAHAARARPASGRCRAIGSRIERRRRMRAAAGCCHSPARDDAPVPLTTGSPQRTGHAAVGRIRLDDDTCRPRTPRLPPPGCPSPTGRASRPAGSQRRPQPEVPVRRGAVQAADEHHVGIALRARSSPSAAAAPPARRRRPPDRPVRRRTDAACGRRSAPTHGGWRHCAGASMARRSGSSCPSGFHTASPAAPPAAAAAAPARAPAAAAAARRRPSARRTSRCPPGKPRIGQASAARNWNSSNRRSRSETFGADPCTART